MAKQDYYQVLGLSRTATPDEIRKAHRKLVRQYHPDVNKNNPAATEKFKEVQEAYDVLSDAQKRQKYDQFGHAGFGAGAEGVDPYEAFRRAQGPRGGARSWRASPNVTVEDFNTGAGGGFADIFEQIFGGGGAGGPMGEGFGGRASSRGRPRPEPQRGADVEHIVHLTFEQAARGTTLPLQINRGGRNETIEIKIPSGVNDGSRIRLKNQGQEGIGGERGDLFIVTRVAPHPYFRREDLDVYVDVPISMYEAMLGTKLDVPTLDGPLTLTIPSGTSSGAKLRIKGHGVERGKEKGDEFVVIKVMVPKTLDDEDKQLIQKLAAKHPIHARLNVPWR